MQTFRKTLFLPKIKALMPEMAAVKITDCKYSVHRFSEWLELEYGNYYYIFYHAKRWHDRITYRKRYFNAFKGEQRGPIIIGDLNSGALEAIAV